MRIYTGIKSVDNNQKLYSNNKKDRLKLEDTSPQEIPDNQKVNQGRNCILIATVAFCMLYYTKNQRSNILQVTASYFTYADNTTKRMVKNHHCMAFGLYMKLLDKRFRLMY